MKKQYLLLTALLAFVFLPIITFAQRHDFFANAPTGQPLYYKINSDSTSVTVVSYHDGGGDDSVTGNLVIPNSVTNNNTTYTITSIGNYAFSYCNISSVIVPNTVTTIGNMAFWNSSSITSITLGNSVTNIGYGAFMYTNISSLIIPASVTYISSQFSGGVYSLDTLIVENGNSVYDSRNNCNAIIETSTNKLIAGCRNTIIPNTVTAIGDTAFALISSPFSIVIPASVSSIGVYAFGECMLTSLTSIATIPPTLGENVFDNVQDTIPIYVRCGNEAAYRADSGWSRFSNIQCRSSVTVSTNDSTMGIVIGSGTYSMGDTATLTVVPTCGHHFVRWNDGVTDSIRHVVIPGYDLVAQFDSTRYRVATPSGQELYYTINCANRTARLVLPDGNIAYGTRLSGNLTVPSYVYINGDYYTVTAIGAGAFAYCYNLTSVTLPNTITTIGARAFLFDDSLTSVTLPSSLTTICYAAFQGCMGLQSITLPNHLTTIDLGAFSGCSSLTSVHIPASVTHIESQIISHCRNLTTITVDTNNNVYDSRDNCNAIIETASNTLINACNNTTTIPASVTAIGDYAFSGCDNLSTLTVLATVPPSLGNNVFQQVPNNIRVIVPCGSEAAYRADSGWSYFTNIVCPTSPTILVTGLANDSLMGSVTGNGLYAEGDTATLTATANCGYRFVRWNDSVTDNPRQVIVATDTTFTAFFVSDADTVFIHDTTTVRDTLMLHDTLLVHDTLTIHDTLLVHDTLTVYDTLTIHDTVGVALAYYTLTVSADPLSGIAVGSGRFSDSTIVEIAAIPVEGNFFVQWSDGNTENPRHVTMTEDITLIAIFDIPPIPTGVAESEYSDAEVSVMGTTITVQGAEGARVRIFDVQGRLIGSTPQATVSHTFRMPATGVYLVQLGNGAARRVVVR